VQKLYKISELINQVSKTRFSNGRHVEKMPHQTMEIESLKLEMLIKNII